MSSPARQSAASPAKPGEGFWAWLRSLFPLGRPKIPQNRLDQPSGISFLELDVDALAHDLRVDREAERYGSAGLPASDQQTPDGAERKIRQEIIRRVQDAKQKALNEEKALRSAIKSRQLAPDVMRSNEIPQKCEQELERRERRLAAEESNLQKRLEDLQKEVDEYRETYGVKRRPRIKDLEDRLNAVSFLVGFSLVQLGSNSLLLARGSAFGLAFGLVVALTVAFFDIFLHFTLGRFASRIVAPDRTNRFVGSLLTLLSPVTVVGLNLATVHLRLTSLASGSGTANWDQWLPGLISSPFAFSDFLSWILFGVGILCSLLAIGSGWIWDDPIPVFRKNGRLIKRLQHDLQDVEEERSMLSETVVSSYEEKLNALDERAEVHVSIISDSVNRIHQLVVDYGGYCTTARETFAALVSRYRDQNRIHRGDTPAPEFFRHSPEISLPTELPISLEELDSVAEREERLYRELQESLRSSRLSLRGLRNNRGSESRDETTA